MAKISNNLTPDHRLQIAMDEIRKILEKTRHGSITLIVQDGIVVQIDKTSKSRIDYSALDRICDGEGI